MSRLHSDIRFVLEGKIEDDEEETGPLPDDEAEDEKDKTVKEARSDAERTANKQKALARIRKELAEPYIHPRRKKDLLNRQKKLTSTQEAIDTQSRVKSIAKAQSKKTKHFETLSGPSSFADKKKAAAKVSKLNKKISETMDSHTFQPKTFGESLQQLVRINLESAFKTATKNILETSWENGLKDNEPRYVEGVKGVKSKPFKRKFKSQADMERFFDSDDASDYDVHRVYRANESSEELRRATDKARAPFDVAFSKFEEAEKELKPLLKRAKAFRASKEAVPESLAKEIETKKSQLEKLQEEKEKERHKFLEWRKQNDPDYEPPAETSTRQKNFAKSAGRYLSQKWIGPRR